MRIVVGIRFLNGDRQEKDFNGERYAFGYVDALCENDLISGDEHSRLVEEIEEAAKP